MTYAVSHKKQAVLLRKAGKTHREIADALHISLSTAWLWLKEVRITQEQKHEIERRRRRHKFTDKENIAVTKRLRPFQYKNQYSDQALLDKIKDFYKTNERIPLKREFNALKIYRDRFGSWNNAIKKAGFETNPVLFAKKFIANDGHQCDSFTEKVIDDWLSLNNIEHQRQIRYGTTKFRADFGLKPDVIIEFFGLSGVQLDYDQVISRKKILAKKLGWNLIEVYPNDLYPINKLPQLLGSYIES